MSDLHADAVRVISGWTAPTVEAEGVRQRFADLLAEQPGATQRDNPGAHITASALVVSHGLDRVLLCLHGRMHRWVQLGGHCEDGDASVAGAALREATEESGMSDLRVHPVPIDLDVHRVNCRYGPALHYDVRFAVLAPVDAVPAVSDESADLAWFEPGALPSPLAHATDRLLVPGLAAARALLGEPDLVG